jgi:hypothetical protein
MAIVTLEQAKLQLNIDPGDTSEDAELQAYCDALTPAIEDYKREVIVLRDVTEDLELCGRYRFRLWSAPVVSLTSLIDVVTGTVWDVTTMRAHSSGVVRVLPGSQAPRGLCEATYKAGYAHVPPNYTRGALVVLQHTWETQRGVGDVGGGVMDSAEERRYDPRYFFTFPRRALEWLGAPRPVVG